MDYPRYNPQSDNLPLSDEELSTLDDMLTKLPSDEAMNIEALDGYLAGLLLSPLPLSDLDGATWLPEVWGGDGEDIAEGSKPENYPFASGKQRKRVTLLVLRHLRSISWQLDAKPEIWEPIFSVAEHEDEDLTDAEEWCLGFLTAVDQAPDAWEPLFADVVTGPLLAPITLLGSDENLLSDEDRSRLADPKQKDELSRAVLDNVLQLWAARKA